MCGIAGCLALALEADPDQGWVRAATERITHRGPDDEGFYTDPDVALGYKRLAIIDLSEGGHQPMRSADGRYWMVYNGEIYNYVELGQELREAGVELRTSSDSEVLLETYARVGKDIVHRLRGMFAFAIWDTWTRELFCARDQFGIKPFYYRLDRGLPAPPPPAPPPPAPPPPAPPPPGSSPEQSRSGGRHAARQAGGGAGADSGATAPAPIWEDWFAPAPADLDLDPDPDPDPGPPAASRGRHAARSAQGGAAQGGAAQGGADPGGAARGGAGGAPGGHWAPGGPPPAPARAAGPGGPAGPASAGGPVGPVGGAEDRMLRFASERKSLAEPGELRDLDGAALRRYLSFQYVPPPGTMTPPVQVLPPGHAMIARPGSPPDVYRYWRADLRPGRMPSDSSARTILEVMRDSVAVHLRSDAPLGAFLSGGIDSAAICALAAEHRPDLLTFTVGFEREGYSEIEAAQETAAALGVTSHPYVITAGEFFHYLPQIIWHLDDPMADAAAVPLWFVAREASKHVKVVLSGEGSDELFGGYAIYHQPGVVRAGERLPDWGRAPLQRAASMLPAGVKGKGLLQRTSTPLRRRYIGNAHVFNGPLLEAVARPPRGSPYDVTDPVYDQADEAGLDDVSTMQLVDINTWLPGDILVKADRMTMAHSLELRVPFLDREVMAVAARLAREEKVGAGTTKIALRDAMSEVLPDAAARRAKLGFPVPIGHWLKGEAHGFAQQVLRNAQTGEWVDREAALSLLDRFRGGDPLVTWRHVWLLIVFSLWHQIFVEHVYDPVALGWERAAGVVR